MRTILTILLTVLCTVGIVSAQDIVAEKLTSIDWSKLKVGDKVAQQDYLDTDFKTDKPPLEEKGFTDNVFKVDMTTLDTNTLKVEVRELADTDDQDANYQYCMRAGNSTTTCYSNSGPGVGAKIIDNMKTKRQKEIERLEESKAQVYEFDPANITITNDDLN